MPFNIHVVGPAGPFTIAVDPAHTIAQIKQTVAVSLQLVITSFTVSVSLMIIYSKYLFRFIFH